MAWLWSFISFCRRIITNFSLRFVLNLIHDVQIKSCCTMKHTNTQQLTIVSGFLPVSFSQQTSIWFQMLKSNSTWGTLCLVLHARGTAVFELFSWGWLVYTRATAQQFTLTACSGEWSLYGCENMWRTFSHFVSFVTVNSILLKA